MDWNDLVPGCVTPEGVATLKCIPAVFQNLVTAALLFAGVIAVIFIILAGMKYMSSGGDPKQIEGARHTLYYAIAGLLLILLSFLIINVIGEITGVTCINVFGFNTCK